MKGGKYTKTLAKIWVEGIIRIRDIRGNVLPKVWRRQPGGRKSTVNSSIPSFATKV